MADFEKIAKIKKSPPLRFFDGLIVLLLIAAVIFPYVVLFRESGETVTVTVDGKQTAVYPLTAEFKQHVIDGHLTLNIEGGEAWISDADCPDKVCEVKKIKRVGEVLICAPNKIVVAVTGMSADIYL